MAWRSRRRHNYKFTGKKHSVLAVVALVLAVIPLLLFLYTAAISYQSGGNAPEWIGGIGILALLTAILSLMFSLQEVRKEEIFKTVPVLAVVLGIAMLSGWFVIYGIGFWVG